MTCTVFNTTPDLIKDLSTYSKFKLAEHLRITDPTKVKVVGSVTLDALGNFVSAEAYIEMEQA